MDTKKSAAHWTRELHSPCPSIQYNSSFVSICKPTLCIYSLWVTLAVNWFKISQLLINCFVSLFTSHASTGREPGSCCENVWICARGFATWFCHRFELMGDRILNPLNLPFCVSVCTLRRHRSARHQTLCLAYYLSKERYKILRDCYGAVLLENKRETAIKSSRCI